MSRIDKFGGRYGGGFELGDESADVSGPQDPVSGAIERARRTCPIGPGPFGIGRTRGTGETQQAPGARPPRPEGPKDATPKRRIDAHVAAYGRSPVSYEKAREKAIQTFLRDADGETPLSILREIGESEGKPRGWAEKELRKLMSERGAKIALLPVGEASESMGEPKDDWIFSLEMPSWPSDHGFWCSVNRKTGKAFVNGFN